MSDRFPGWIYIGGKLRKKNIANLASMLQCLRRDYGESYLDIQEAKLYIAETVKKEEALFGCDEDARGGEFEELENFCDKVGLFFRRISDSRYEYDREIKIRNSTGVKTCICSSSEEPLIPLSTLTSILGHSKTIKQVKEKVKKQYSIFDEAIAKLEII
jgi:hypothetical protein